jgi:hypothetical protein
MLGAALSVAVKSASRRLPVGGMLSFASADAVLATACEFMLGAPRSVAVKSASRRLPVGGMLSFASADAMLATACEFMLGVTSSAAVKSASRRLPAGSYINIHKQAGSANASDILAHKGTTYQLQC